jgi:hypothetical protein
MIEVVSSLLRGFWVDKQNLSNQLCIQEQYKFKYKDIVNFFIPDKKYKSNANRKGRMCFFIEKTVVDSRYLC